MDKNNNFGFLRLLLAYLVIVAHAGVFPDSKGSYESVYPLIYPFANGSLPVDGFFLISGYLIYKSCTQSTNLFSYFKKRVLRIYPGFIAASLFCLLLVSPVSGSINLLNNLTIFDWLNKIVKMLVLLPVSIDGIFPNGMPLNSPMWTIKFEFICYLLVPILVCLLNKPYKLLLVFISVSVLHILSLHLGWGVTMPFLDNLSKLISSFLAGSLFYVYKDRIVWKKTYSIACFILLIPIMYLPYFADIGIVTFGGYILFNFAFNYDNKSISAVGKNTDISYGVYLYAWPITGLLIQFIPGGEWIYLVLTLLLATLLGFISWHFVEKPFIQMKQKLNTRD